MCLLVEKVVISKSKVVWKLNILKGAAGNQAATESESSQIFHKVV